MTHLIHLEPRQAVAEARRQDDPEQAAERLDRYLRARLLDFLQNREGDRVELTKALVAARAWALREMEPYIARWSLLLEVLEDSRQVPARAEQLELLTEGELAIVAQLVAGSEESSQLRPKDLAEQVGKSEQNVNNYLRRMEKAGLVVRHRVAGQKAVLVFPTHRAVQLAKGLGLPRPAAEPKQGASNAMLPGLSLAPEAQLWHLSN